MKAEIKEIVFYILENYIDVIMEPCDFKRRGNSLNYFRTIGTTKQKLEMACFSHPPYYAGALLHIYPFIQVYYPEVNRAAENVVADRNKYVYGGNMSLRQPIQLTSSGTEQWILMTGMKEETDALAEKIGIFLKQYTIPLLDDLKTIDDYIDKYVKHDKRIIKDDIFYLLVASAYAYKEDYAKGLEVLNYRYQGPAIRRKFSEEFQYFEQKIGK